MNMGIGMRTASSYITPPGVSLFLFSASVFFVFNTISLLVLAMDIAIYRLPIGAVKNAGEPGREDGLADPGVGAGFWPLSQFAR